MDRPTEYSATNLLKALLLPGFYEALRGVNPDDFGDYYALREQLEEQQFDFIGQAAPGIEAALNRYMDRQLAAPMVPAVRGEDYDPRMLAAIFLDPSTPERELESASLYGYRAGDDADADTVGTAPNLLAEYCHLLADGDRADALAILAILVGDFDAWRQALAGEDLDTLQRDLKAEAEGVRIRHIVKVRVPKGTWRVNRQEGTLDVEVSTVVAEGETVAEAIRSCQLGAPLLDFESPEPWSGPAPRRSLAPAPESARPLIPPNIVQALLSSGHEIVPAGSQQAGFRALLMRTIGKPVPESKAGVTAVTKALAEYLGVDTNRTGYGAEAEMRAKLAAMLAAPELEPPVRGDLNPYGRPKMSVDDRGSRESEANRALSAINEGMTLLRGGFRSRKGADDTAGQWNAVVRAIRGSEATAAAYFYDYAPKGIPAYADRRAWWRWNDDYNSLSDDKERLPFRGTLYYGAMPETAPEPAKTIVPAAAAAAASNARLESFKMGLDGIHGISVPSYLLPATVDPSKVQIVYGDRGLAGPIGVYTRSKQDYRDPSAWTPLPLPPEDFGNIASWAAPYYVPSRLPAPAPEPPVREVAPGVTAYEFSRMQDDDAKRQAAASLVSQLSPRRAPVAEPEPAPAPRKDTGLLIDTLPAVTVPKGEVAISTPDYWFAVPGTQIKESLLPGWRFTFYRAKEGKADLTGWGIADSVFGVRVAHGGTQDLALEVLKKRIATFEANGMSLREASDAMTEKALGLTKPMAELPTREQWRADSEAVNDTILEQLGGRNQLKAMIGLTQVSQEYANKKKRGGVTLYIPKSPTGAVQIVIRLRYDDTYFVEVLKGTTRKGYFPIKTAEGLFADQLVPVIEEATGLRLSLGRTGNPRRRSNPDIGTSMIYGYGINQMTPSAPMGGRTANGAASVVRQARLAAEAERLAQRLARGRR